MGKKKINMELDIETLKFYEENYEKRPQGIKETLETVARNLTNHPAIKFSHSTTEGLDYILSSTQQLYRRTLSHLKGTFEKNELMLIVDVMNATLLTGRFSGILLMGNIEDGIALDRLDDKWEVDSHNFLSKLKTLSPFDIATLELWAFGFWYGENSGKNLDKYVAQLEN